MSLHPVQLLSAVCALLGHEPLTGQIHPFSHACQEGCDRICVVCGDPVSKAVLNEVRWVAGNVPRIGSEALCCVAGCSVPVHGAQAFEAAMADALPHLFQADCGLLHRLVTMLSPTQLAARGVPVCRLVHVPGNALL